VNSDTERIQRIVRAAPRPEPVRDSEEVFLIDRVQQLGHRPLDDLVLQGGDSERTLPAIRFGNVDPSRRQCPIRSPLDAVVQVPEVALEICFVVAPYQSIHSGCGVLLEFMERLLQPVDTDMVEERGEPVLLPFPCDFPYALQLMGHACPALRPARALLARIPLGPCPSLHRLRN
jgi:hypothetical protein